jgi:Asp/Glu/hydantoin racemase
MSEHNKYDGGYHTYGSGIGVMMLDTRFPRPPGDVGNSQTYDYPVFYEVVDGADPVRVVREQDAELLDPFVEAAEHLVDRGAVAITTGCGFLLMFQDELAARIPDVPLYTSSLLQIPLVKTMLAPDQKIGVLSADENSLNRIDHPVLTDNRDRLVYEGVADSGAFQDVIIEQTNPTLDLDAVGADVVAAAERLVEGENVGAIIFECTNLRPYVEEVQDATGLPVFDYLTLSDMAWQAASGTRF